VWRAGVMAAHHIAQHPERGEGEAGVVQRVCEFEEGGERTRVGGRRGFERRLEHVGHPGEKLR
jgi:hypothetical protein